MNKLKHGYTGYQDGHAVMILAARSTPYGKMYLCKVYDPKNPRKQWTEAMSDKLILDVLPCPESREVPDPKTFRVIKIKTPAE